MKFSNIQIPLLFVVLMWIPFLAELAFNTDISWLGIYPREFKSLGGIFLSPFIHGDINHLMNNTLPMLVLGSLTYYFYRPVFYKAYFYSIFFTGLLVWLFARPSFHIGASGIIYALASLLFFSGMFRKSYRLVAVSLIVVFLYGGMVWGVLPLKEGISWESHLFGGIVGGILALKYRKWVFLEKKVYRWENDEEDIRRMESVYGERYWNKPPVEEQRMTIRYFFKPNEEKKN